MNGHDEALARLRAAWPDASISQDMRGLWEFWIRQGTATRSTWRNSPSNLEVRVNEMEAQGWIKRRERAAAPPDARDYKPLPASGWPWAQDLDLVWHRRPEGDHWRAFSIGIYAGPQCSTICGQEIHSVHVSSCKPEADKVIGSTLCWCVTTGLPGLPALPTA